jgi:hypothetical protein
MIDLETGDVAYAVLSFGGILGMGDKLFAVPWGALALDADRHEFLLDVDKETLKNAPGFDPDDWPDFADPSFGVGVHNYYRNEPYWERSSGLSMRQTQRRSEAGSEKLETDAARERINQPDLPEELRRKPIDVMNFPGRDADADLKTADASRTYAVNDTTTWKRD